MTDLDIGYSPSSQEWTFLNSYKINATRYVDTEYALIGNGAISLLNAAKRLKQYAPGSTIETTISCIRRAAQAIHSFVPDSEFPEEWAEALKLHLAADSAIVESSRWSLFNNASALFAEVSRHASLPYRVSNPFKKRRVGRVALVSREHQETLIRGARKEALDYLTRFRSPNPDHIPFIESARKIASETNAVFTTKPRSAGYNLVQRWHSKTKLNVDFLTGYLYPSANDLAPFLIMLAHELAGNAESVSLMRRDAMVSFMHPAYGERHRLTLEKPRAGSIAPYLLRNNGTFSAAWIVKCVLELTESLVPAAEPEHRNFAFLIGTGVGGHVRLLVGIARAWCVRDLHRRVGLEPATLPQLRQSRGIDKYNETGNVFEVKRLLNQSNIRSTLGYLDERLTHDTDAATIADAQIGMLVKSAPPPERQHDGTAASVGSHQCADPYDASKAHDEHGFCASFLWPFNDRHFVFDFSPRPVAFLLRDYEALCEAEKSLPAPRFAKIYQARKAKIERDILPRISTEVREQARQIMLTLPPTPVIT
jgi:hypothetical protein